MVTNSRVTSLGLAPAIGNKHVRESLRRGLTMSNAVMGLDLVQLGIFTVFAKPDWRAKGAAWLEYGHADADVSGRADQLLTDLLARLFTIGCRCTLAEDTVGVVRWPPESRATIPGGLINWVAMTDEGAEECLNVVNTAMDFCRNAFVSFLSPRELGLVPGIELDPDAPRRLASSLAAIVVDAFDGESYVVWTAHEAPVV